MARQLRIAAGVRTDRFSRCATEDIHCRRTVRGNVRCGIPPKLDDNLIAGGLVGVANGVHVGRHSLQDTSARTEADHTPLPVPGNGVLPNSANPPAELVRQGKAA